MAKLELSTITLCAATSVNVDATITALRLCLSQVDFAECMLFTDVDVGATHPEITVIPVAQLGSARAYSEFVLHGLATYVRSSHCLIIQWDGFILDARSWDNEFLKYDYVGAPWPQFGDGHNVGNGGFSLRSRKLLDACQDPDFRSGHPEDLAICRDNRRFLEERHSIRFADHDVAARFAFERSAPRGPTFGFHGIFNMAKALGVDRFWSIYRTLDDPRTAFVDFWPLFRQLGEGHQSVRRRVRLSLDRLAVLLRR